MTVSKYVDLTKNQIGELEFGDVHFIVDKATVTTNGKDIEVQDLGQVWGWPSDDEQCEKVADWVLNSKPNGAETWRDMIEREICYKAEKLDITWRRCSDGVAV